jgi:hypothetical protein
MRDVALQPPYGVIARLFKQGAIVPFLVAIVGDGEKIIAAGFTFINFEPCISDSNCNRPFSFFLL